MKKTTNVDEKTSLGIVFVTFLIFHLIIWSVLPLLRLILPIDAAECVYWGSFNDFGTNKHPPLAGWIAYFVYHLFGNSDYSIYFLGQLLIIIGFIYLYKLGKFFLSKKQSILAVMIMEACFAYTYMGIYDGFNPNFILLAFLPIITYYFYKSVNIGSIFDWCKLGIFVGLSFLAKYQTIMLFIPLFAYLFITKIGREQFKKKGLYIAAFIALIIVLPHIIWLFKNEFFSFNYFIICEQKYAQFYSGHFKYIYSPLVFLFNQIVAVIGVIFIYLTAFIFSNEKIIKNDNRKPEQDKFLICAGIIPILLQSLHGLNGNYMIPQWGYSLLFMTGILLFYFFPFKISDKVIKYIISWIIGAMFITFLVLSIVFCTERNFANRFPVQQVTNTLNQIYETKTGRPMKYIGGFIELSIPISLYNNGKYIAVLNTYKHPNIWINNDDMKESGIIFVARVKNHINQYIESAFPNISHMPDVCKFKFTVKSVIGKEREYNMYYAIIPPSAE